MKFVIRGQPLSACSSVKKLFSVYHYSSELCETSGLFLSLSRELFIKPFETILDLVDKCNSFLKCKISLSNVTGPIISMFVLVRFVAVFERSCVTVVAVVLQR